MAIEKKPLGTEDDPNVVDTGNIIEIIPEPTREDQIREAAQILVTEEALFVDEEIDAEQPASGLAFDDNLVEELDAFELGKLSSSILSSIQADRESRSDWEKTYVDGLKYLGMRFEETRSQPFDGSTGVMHPLLAEATTQFQAQAFKELLPARGPVKTEIIGARTPDVEAQADRVQEFMNYYIMNEIPGYSDELDMLLFYLPLAGSAFKKVHFDTVTRSAVSSFVEPQDLIVPYESSDLHTAERVTQVIAMSRNEIRKQQLAGFYADVDIKDGGAYIKRDEIDEQIDEIEGMSPSYDSDRDHLIYEVHTVLDLPGFEDLGEDGQPTGLKLPYIVTIDDSSRQVLAIRRNYREQDPFKRKVNYFVQYKFLPGLGFYGLGLSHMIGGLAKASTSLLRQLIDAGTLANLPAGFKARGMRIRDEDEPLQPGEFRDIDTTGASLKENLIPLPIKEPSTVLMTLLGTLVESGKRFAAIADTNVADMNQAMPVGTTVALLERGTKVMSAIHKRLHHSQKLEFQLLAQVFAEYLPPVYPYRPGVGAEDFKVADFDARIDIIPVSDPNIFSQSQRITMAQELLTMVQSNPDIHGPQGIYEAYRRMYSALGVDDVESLIQPPQEPPPPSPLDAGIENSGLLVGQPQIAFAPQNHRAHVEAHRALFMTEVVKTNPALQGNILAHIMQHLQFLSAELAQDQIPPELSQQMEQINMAAEQGQIDPELPQMMNQEMQMTVEQFSSPVLAQLTSDLLQSIGQGDEEDPLVAIRQRELELRDKEIDLDQANFESKQQARSQEKLLEAELAKQRIDNSKSIADDKLDVALRRLQQNADLKLMEIQQRSGGRQ
jgi:hypothetical protein